MERGNYGETNADNLASKITRRDLHEKRIKELLDHCQEQVMQQIIGPFGLTPELFQDKDGGNITTNHNFRKGVVATAEDGDKFREFQSNNVNSINRQCYDKQLPAKRKIILKNAKVIKSAYTGLALPGDGRMQLDHVIPVKKIETDPGAVLNLSKKERIRIANENLAPCESSINQSMQHKGKIEWAKSRNRKDPSKTNAEHYKVDLKLLRKAVSEANVHFEAEKIRGAVIKQGGEILKTGISDAKRNAIQQAMGMLIFEVANGAYVEVKRVIAERNIQKNVIDQLTESLENLANRIISKSGEVFDRIVAGGVQGFLSNFLTYLINLLITTSAKVVAIIRESISELWKAIKLVWNPPANMTKIEIAREISKIIASVITASIGVLLEKSVQAFILTIPVLIPIADTLSPAITAILTGVSVALVIFGIDSVFDWLSTNGTEFLEDQLENLNNSLDIVEKVAQNLDSQFRLSRNYQLCVMGYSAIEDNMLRIDNMLGNVRLSNNRIIESKQRGIENFKAERDKEKTLAQKMRELGIEE